MLSQGNIDSDVVIAFFDTFISELTRKTVIVMDNSTCHTSGAIEAKKAEWQSKNLEIFYLPKSLFSAIEKYRVRPPGLQTLDSSI